MGPKKKKGKGKKGMKGKKPKPDPGWAKTIQYGKWERPYESLPDVVQWPAFTAIRVQMMEALQHLSIIWSETLGEYFLAELMSIPRPNLVFLELRGTKLLKKFVLSPYDVFPALNHLDLSCCPILEHVLIQGVADQEYGGQNSSLETATFTRCMVLKKLLLETKNLKQLNVHTCIHLGTLMIWSDQLTALNLAELKEIKTLELYCPLLVDIQQPVMLVKQAPKVYHPTIIQILKATERRKDPPSKEWGLLEKDLMDTDEEVLTYPNYPLIPRTLLLAY